MRDGKEGGSLSRAARAGKQIAALFEIEAAERFVENHESNIGTQQTRGQSGRAGLRRRRPIRRLRLVAYQASGRLSSTRRNSAASMALVDGHSAATPATHIGDFRAAGGSRFVRPGPPRRCADAVDPAALIQLRDRRGRARCRGDAIRAIVPTRLDFPAPDGPTMATWFAGWIVRLMSRRTV